MERDNENTMREIEANERWLARFDHPATSPDATARLKRAVRVELARESTQQAVAWRPWHGGMAAAAMLLLSVGVVQYARWATPQVEQDLLLVDAGEYIMTIESESSIADESLDDLSDMDIGESWALSGASLYDTFEDAFNDEDGTDAGEAGVMLPAGVRIDDGAVG